MAQSNFGKKRNDAIERYVSKLVLFVSKCGGEKQEELVAKSLMNIKVHKFMELDPQQLERSISGLREKLIIHADEERERRLDGLIIQLKQRDLKKDYEKVHERIIKLLINLSNTSTEALPNDTILKRTKKVQPVIFPNFGAQSIKAAIRLEDGPRDESLSDSMSENITESEEEIQHKSPDEILNAERLRIKEALRQRRDLQPPKPINSENPKFCGSLRTPCFFGGLPFTLRDMSYDDTIRKIREEHEEDEQLRISTQFGTKRSLKSTDVDEFDEDEDIDEINNPDNTNVFANPNSLADKLKGNIMRLERARISKNHLGVAHWLYSKISEREISEELIAGLICKSDNTQHYIFDHELGKYRFKLPLELGHLSMLSFRNSVEIIFEFMRKRRVVLDFLERREHRNIVVLESLRNNASGVDLEFCERTQNLLIQLNLQCSKIRQSQTEEFISKEALTLQSLEGYLSSYSDIYETLSTLFTWIDENSRRLDVLLASEMASLEAKANKNCYLSVAIQDKLFDLLKENAYGNSLTSKHTQDFIRSSFANSIISYLEFIESWVKYGRINDFHGEFFIQKVDSFTRDQNELKIDWDKSFSIRRITATDRNSYKLIVPAWCDGHAQDILTAGKTALFNIYLRLHQRKSGGFDEAQDFNLYEKIILDIQRRYGNSKKMDQELNRQKPIFEKLDSQEHNKNTFNSFLKKKKKGVQLGFKLEVLEQTDCFFRQSQTTIYAGLPLDSNCGFNLFTTKQDFDNIDIGEEPRTIKKCYLFANKLDEANKIKSILSEKLQEASTCTKVTAEVSDLLCNAIVSVRLFNIDNFNTLLNSRFNIEKLFSDVRKIYFLEKIYLANDSFQELLSESDEYLSYAAYIEKFKQTFREMIEKLNPEIKSYFSIVKGNYADLGGPLGNIISHNLQIKFSPPYPLDVFFGQECQASYHRVFSFLMHFEKTRLSVISKFAFLKQLSKFRLENFRLVKETLPIDLPTELTDQKIRFLFNELITKVRVAQSEYLRFIDTYASFIRNTVLGGLSESFSVYEALKKGVGNLVAEHAKYLRDVLEYTFLGKKTANLLSFILACFDSCLDFSNLCRKLESALLIGDSDLEEQMATVSEGLVENLHQFRKSLSFILEVLHGYIEKGNDFKMTELYTVLNFNNYYLGDDGKIIGQHVEIY